MKFSKFLLGGAALVLAASCSNDLNEPSKGGSQQGGDGYIAVKVNLPQTKTSRASNDNYNDGKAEEYFVEDMCLILFAGDTEAEATQTGAYSLTDLDKTEWENDWNVTDSYMKVVSVKDVKSDTKNWGLVLVNYKKIGDINEGKFEITGKGVANKLEDFTTNVNSNLSNFVDTKYFFMANIPASTVAGAAESPLVNGKASIQTLVLMDNTLYDTQEAARTNPSANFFVERAVAKATLTKPTNMKVDITTTLEGENATKTDVNGVLTITELKWGLDNCEPNSYLVRNMGSVDTYLGYANDRVNDMYKYRMVGDTKLGKNINSLENVYLYRTYWCIDPKYGTDKDTDVYATYEYNEDGTIKSISPNFTMKDAGETTATAEPLYCHENTFDVLHQNHQNTTRAVVAVKMNGGDTFWTINGRQDKLYTSLADAESFSRTYIVKSTQIYNAVYNALATPSDINELNTVENISKLYDITFTRDKDGIRVVKDVTPVANWRTLGDFDAAKDITLDETTKKKLIDNCNAQYKIAEYANGVNYYNIWIRHFAGNSDAQPGDAAYDLAPWIAGTDVPADVVKTDDTVSNTNFDVSNGSYDNADRENLWLGRYGMVRNNWYDISVGKIQHLGTPEITNVNVDKTPDDEKDEEKWVSFTINVLSWAKRSQNHDL